MASFEQILAPIQRQLDALQTCMGERLNSPIPLIQAISQHLLSHGGKRLRPSLILLLADHFDDNTDRQIELALIIEFIHNATLLHDDVVDNSSLRRGQPTANAIWDNQASVLVGDFLLARSFQLLVGLEHQPLTALLAHTTQAIAEGEVLQIENRADPNTTIERYLEVIDKKTAALFAAACEGSAMLAACSEADRQHARDFGRYFGIAFQLIDDALDYAIDNPDLDKNAGDDLAEGKPTLPLIYALQNSQGEQQKILHQAIVDADREQLQAVIAIIHQTGGIEYTQARAQHYADKAIYHVQQLSAQKHQQTFIDIINFAMGRTY